jgi:hypothetical protein
MARRLFFMEGIYVVTECNVVSEVKEKILESRFLLEATFSLKGPVETLVSLAIPLSLD